MDKTFIYIENTSNDPYFNQAFEEYIFNNYTEGDIFLLWRNRPAVVCGCYQNIFAEVNAIEAEAADVALIRRISGGGTVYHDLGNINYSMIVSKEDLELNYEMFLEPMVRALNRIGAPVSINRKSDISIDGLKVSGSAQKATMRRILHHGTLLYDCDLGVLSALSNGQRPHFETKGVASVPWPVTNIRPHMADQSMSTEEFEAAILSSIAEEYTIERRELSDEELAEVRELAKSKYQSWDWTFGKSPSFICRSKFELDGTETSLEYSSKKGVIEEIAFAPAVPELEEALTGRRLDMDEIKELLSSYEGYSEIYKYIF